jgi:heptose-I-phosphate ethanolaminephosphotransferase
MLHEIKRTKPRLALSVLLTLFWATALSVFCRNMGIRKFSEFLLPFGANCLLMYAVTVLPLFRSKSVKLIRALIVGFLALSAFGTTIIYLYYKKMRHSFSSGDILAVLQSDFSESYSYALEHVLTLRSIALAFIALILTLLVIRFSAAAVKDLNINQRGNKSLLAVGSLLAIGAAFMLLSQHNIIKTIYDSCNQYYKDIKIFHEYRSRLENQPADVAVKKEQGDLYVIVIGESESRDLMHCYGGAAENTPWADTLRGQPDWVVFENAYAFHTHTEPVLTAAITDGRALTGLTFPKGQNIISVSRQAGLHTYWLSNQAPFGAYDTQVTAIANLADQVRFTTDFHSYRYTALPPDTVLLPLLEQTLGQLNHAGNSLLVVHLIGNHAPYKKHYPDDFPLLNIEETKFLGRLAGEGNEKWNYQRYATSIRHTDEVLKNIFSSVAELADRPVVFLYFSDHGDDVFSDFGHNFKKFSWPMSRIPMFLWFSRAFQEKYPDKVFFARANRDKIFTNDLIYDLYLGLANIQTESYLAEYDISSEKYCLTLENAVIAEGKQIKADPAIVASRNLRLEHGPALAAHRVNSLFKLKEAQASGLRRFEVDVRYEEAAGRALLSVGHDPDSMAGLNFFEYMERLDKGGFDFLWMDFKNLTEENCAAVLELLNLMDAKYELRSRILLETARPEAVGILSVAGWNTSYYLNWPALTAAFAAGQEETLRRLSADIGGSVRRHGFGAVSYDLKADEAVKKYVRPELPPGTKLYAWNTDWAYSEPDLPDKIKNYEHLACLLVSWPSPFHL